MATKTTGALFKAFYNDETYWKPGIIVDDQLLSINGVETDDDFDIDSIKDEEKVSILCGVVYNENSSYEEYANESKSLEKFFKDWLKQQTTTYITVALPKTDEYVFRELMKQLKYKIL